MAGEARVIRAPHYIDLLERGRAAERADSIRSVSEVEESTGSRVKCTQLAA
eukprot:COSAG02_NODE_2687_length_8234_cov_83.523417_2_plen_51_part_00